MPNRLASMKRASSKQHKRSKKMKSKKRTKRSILEEDDQTAHADDLLSHMLGLTPQRIAATKQVMFPTPRSELGQREKNIKFVRERARDLEDEFGESVLLCARSIWRFLDRWSRFAVASDGQYIRSIHAVSDLLGKKGLSAPRIFIDGKTRYALAFINSSEEEKAAGQERLNALSELEKAALAVA